VKRIADGAVPDNIERHEPAVPFPGLRSRRLRPAATLFAIASFLGLAAQSRVIVLVERPSSIYQEAARGFEQSFQDSAPFEVTFIDDPRQLDTRMGAVRAAPPQLVVAIGTQAAAAARTRLRNVPLIYCLALNPDQHNLTGPLVGGVRLNVPVQQVFDEVQKVLPKLERIGVVYDEQVSGQVVREAQRYLKGKVRLVARDARTQREAAQAIEEMMGQIDAFWLLWDPVVVNPASFRLLVERSLENRVALIAPARPFVEAGALMSVAPNYGKAGERAGELAKQFLAGKPDVLRAEAPPETVLTINGPVAQKLGVQIPRNHPAEILSGTR
jgi:putative tryptophan/tyrosine transport system substrate-binding protein